MVVELEEGAQKMLGVSRIIQCLSLKTVSGINTAGDTGFDVDGGC